MSFHALYLISGSQRRTPAAVFYYTALIAFLIRIMPFVSAALPSTTIKHLFLILLLSWSVHLVTCISMLVLIT